MGHAGEVYQDGTTGDVAPDCHIQRMRGFFGLLGAENIADEHGLAADVGHLHADGSPAGDGREDSHIGRGHGVGDVFVETGETGDFGAFGQLQLVASDGGADDHAD